jgi:hypothetical protein
LRAAAALLIVAGLLLLFGAQAPWVICSMDPCPGPDGGFGLMVIWTRSGLTVGWGFLTGVLGVVVLAAAARLGTVRRAALVARLAGLASLVVAFAFASRVWIFPEY